MKSKVYFSKTISPEKIIELIELSGKKLPGSIAVKVHSGEVGNQNFLRPEFWKPVVDHVGGTIVECNTAYEGGRDTTEHHWKTMELHGWSHYFDVDIMDAEGPDKVLDIPDGRKIKKNYVGKNIDKYDSMLVLSHFKGHPMGGYGGALKQLSIGVASSYGKKYIHGVGDTENFRHADHDSFLESMADAASSTRQVSSSTEPSCTRTPPSRDRSGRRSPADSTLSPATRTTSSPVSTASTTAKPACR